MFQVITRAFSLAFAVLLLSQFGPWSAGAQTSGFTYQGKLSDGGNPANGTYDVQFKLFDTATVGTGAQQGATVTNSTLTVSAGIFTVQLDFGAGAFSGAPRFLEIGVRAAGDSNPYNVLGPRQPLTSTPYSVRSLNSSVADVLSSSCVGCVTSAQIGAVSGSVVSGTIPVASVPAGSNNYLQNTTSQQPSSNFNISGNGRADSFTAATQFNIANFRVLSRPGNLNIFVGAGSGTSNTVGGGNSFVGANAGNSNTTGSQNSFFGNAAGFAGQTGSNNSFFGFAAGNFNTANQNSFFGSNAGAANTDGAANTFVGFNAGNANTASQNTFVGAEAGVANTSGSGNLFAGFHSGHSNTIGYFNTFVGEYAGAANQDGAANSFYGENAGFHTTSGGENTFVGGSSGENNASGSDNSFVGQFAGQQNTVGSNNSALGARADFGSGNLSFATAIGAGAVVSNSNSIVLGRANGSDVVRIPGAVLIDGTLVVGSLGSAGSTQVCLNSANRIAGCSSSLRYKTGVQPFRAGLDIVQRLHPISFNWKDGGQRDLGLGAEDVARVEPLLTFRNQQGQIEGVRYNQLSAVLINAIKEQQSQLTSLQRIIEELQRQVANLTATVPSRSRHRQRPAITNSRRRQSTEREAPSRLQ